LVGADTADLVLRILDGQKPSDIPIAKGSFARPIFDWRELQRFGVDERKLPKDSEIRFRPPTFWDQYRWQAITVAAILAIQALMISGLLIERRRRRFAEADARRHLLELTHLNRAAAVSVMSTSIAHELNQPLGAIQSNAEAATLYLKKNPPALEKVERILVDICRDDQRAADIINRVRGLLKKRDELEWRGFDFNGVARDALEIVRTEGKKRGIEIDENLAGVALPVRGDRIHLQQVIINLAMNGLDAMENCVSGNRRMAVHTVLADNSTLKFLVIDAGPGIPVDKLNRVFDAFYTTKRQGTGLGLSIAREIVETLGGKIWAENRSGGGAMLCFTLPLSKRASS
jgi:signal transduction histidine kinase